MALTDLRYAALLFNRGMSLEEVRQLIAKPDPTPAASPDPTPAAPPDPTPATPPDPFNRNEQNNSVKNSIDYLNKIF